MFALHALTILEMSYQEELDESRARRRRRLRSLRSRQNNINMEYLLQVSKRQLEQIVSFVESNIDVTFLKCSPSKAEDAWHKLASCLNSLAHTDREGCMKSPEAWKRYWNTMKLRTMVRADNAKGQVGKPNAKVTPLSKLDERILKAYNASLGYNVSLPKTPHVPTGQSALEKPTPVAEALKEPQKGGNTLDQTLDVIGITTEGPRVFGEIVIEEQPYEEGNSVKVEPADEADLVDGTDVNKSGNDVNKPGNDVNKPGNVVNNGGNDDVNYNADDPMESEGLHTYFKTDHTCETTESARNPLEDVDNDDDDDFSDEDDDLNNEKDMEEFDDGDDDLNKAEDRDISDDDFNNDTARPKPPNAKKQVQKSKRLQSDQPKSDHKSSAGNQRPDWFISLEQRKMASEEKMADALKKMADAAMVNAETMRMCAQAMISLRKSSGSGQNQI